MKIVKSYRLKAALRYYLTSRHRRGHGIHSPFVYNFIREVLNRPVPVPESERIERIRKQLAKSDGCIEMNDLGAGSQYNSSNKRRISEIYRHASVRRRYGRVLFNLATEKNGGLILELGTSLGIGTIYLASAATESKIISLDANEGLTRLAKKNMQSLSIGNVDIITSDFEGWLNEQHNISLSPSLVFVDGDHRKEATINFFHILKELVTSDAIILFDDINYSPEMNEAWIEIKKDPQVSLSIDIFQMGAVFFRKGMVKQDFIIRY